LKLSRDRFSTTLAGKTALVTGGLGFIGSNLAIELVELGLSVTIVDSLVPNHGGNVYNIEPIRDRVAVDNSDLREPGPLNRLVRDKDYIFHLAGQVSHGDSMREPRLDLDVNCVATMNLMEACRRHNPDARLVYTSTRQVYGVPRSTPVNEDHPTIPIDVNGINKLAGEYYHLLYDRTYGVRSTVLRLTNTYGPRQQIANDRQGFIGVMIHRALTGLPIHVFGTGNQVRDFNYIDDVVDAILLAAITEDCRGRVFNLGCPEHLTVLDVAKLLVEFCGARYELVPFPTDNRIVDIGDYYGDFSKFNSVTGWQPKTDLRTGIERAVQSYHDHWGTYLGGASSSRRSGVSRIPVFDYLQQYEQLKDDLRHATERGLGSGSLILGPEVAGFEQAFSEFLGTDVPGVGVASGTDALQIALRGLGIGQGDEVVTVANAAVPTVAAIRAVGARPVFCDVDPKTALIDPENLAWRLSARTKGVIVVHLFGGVVDVARVRRITDPRGLFVIEDCAQAHGAKLQGRSVGLLGHVAAFSFYPTKNLGAFGDGGMCVSTDPSLADLLRSLRTYGLDEYGEAQVDGYCSRLDELQAALLSVKLRHLPEQLERRRQIAARYDVALDPTIVRIASTRGALNAPHLYVVRVKQRDRIRTEMARKQIGCGVHYPKPVHRMPAYADLGYAEESLPHTERLCREVLSLPLYPELTNAAVDRVCDTLNSLAPR
jgi:dTDP-4-amino-4,6-dideoxygalactose transaminase/nucleoside-diphosphate-sugar epimerase